MEDDLDLSDLEATLRKKKKRINSRRKGANFERQLAKLFNSKFKTKEFARTPGSGAFATTHDLPEHIAIYGDLITPKEFIFVIEAKSGYNINIFDLFKENNELDKFIRQAKRDSKNNNKDWLLIYKKTRNKPIVITKLKKFHQYLKDKEVNIPNKQISLYLLDDILNLPTEIFLYKDNTE